MKIKHLIELLSDLPLEADIYLEGPQSAIDDFVVETITDVENSPNIVGYMLCEKLPQLKGEKNRWLQ